MHCNFLQNNPDFFIQARLQFSVLRFVSQLTNKSVYNEYFSDRQTGWKGYVVSCPAGSLAWTLMDALVSREVHYKVELQQVVCINRATYQCPVAFIKKPKDCTLVPV